MGYSAYLRPRAETLAGEIEGIIDLANLKVNVLTGYPAIEILAPPEV
jgi:hypothetical protein